MSKLSIDQHGIQVETHEKTNVMSPFHTMAVFVVTGTVCLMIFCSEYWGKIIGAVVLTVFVFVWLIVYCCHSIKRPELLQSESYRIEMHKIESGMIENNKDNVSNNILTTNTSLLIEQSKEADIND